MEIGYTHSQPVEPCLIIETKLKLMKHHLCSNVLVLLAVTTAIAQTAQPATSGGEIVGNHAIVLNAPVGEPTQFMARGPLLGNGDIGVMQSGPAEQLRFSIGKNDFWTIKHQAPITVGQLRILTPELGGAKFQTVSDMRLAEIRGDYATGDSHMASRAWVDANRNLLCVELSNRGAKPLAISVQNLKGAGATSVPASVPGSPQPVMIGCEQHGGGRWYFNGEMADVTVLDRALTAGEIAVLAKAGRRDVQTFDGKAGKPLTAPAISKALTVSGWIKAATRSAEADYIVSKGEWNSAYSLGLSNGHLRFSIGGFMLQTDEQLPLNQWVHVAGVFDGKQMAVLVNGNVRQTTGSASEGGLEFLYDPDAPNPAGRKVGVATRVLGSSDAGAFNLAPGKSVVVVTAILSDLDAKDKDPLAAAKALVAGLTPDQLAASIAAHRQWWQEFWGRSFIEIPDKTIEQCWYSSWYIMASCSRAGKVAPGLWGNWITVNDPAWHGDFHLNYNFEAPFYGLYSSNHADTTLPYYDAMNQSIPRGKRIAEKRGWKGIHLPVSIGPWGMCPEGDDSDWGQRSNTAYAALPYVWHWQHTQDVAWLKATGYTYLRETALFWENYLKLENGPDGKPRYVIYSDSIHEGSGPDFNPILSLGLVRTLFKNLIPMSQVLGVDADKRAKWQDIIDKMSAYPTQDRGGKTVFRYSEKGMAWNDGNTLGIQHIYPAGDIGLDSDPKLLEISHNMIDAMGRWRDFNGSSSWYAACARVGYDPKRILTELRGMYDRHTLPNKLLNFGGGGIENVSPALAVTEMLLQSHEGVIRFFPCWPLDQPARFGTLRAVGAFFVSAELKDGKVSGASITSEKGRTCSIVNPWPNQTVRVIRNGTSAETVSGLRFTLKTGSGEMLGLEPR